MLELPMRDRVVISVPLHLMLEGSVEGIVQACSDVQRLYNTVDHARDPQDIRRHSLHMQTQLELVAGGMEGVASAWGPDPFQGPPPPRQGLPMRPHSARPHSHVMILSAALQLSRSGEPGVAAGGARPEGQQSCCRWSASALLWNTCHGSLQYVPQRTGDGSMQKLLEYLGQHDLIPMCMSGPWIHQSSLIEVQHGLLDLQGLSGQGPPFIFKICY